jgi:hypothetical protein
VGAISTRSISSSSAIAFACAVATTPSDSPLIPMSRTSGAVISALILTSLS